MFNLILVTLVLCVSLVPVFAVQVDNNTAPPTELYQVHNNTENVTCILFEAGIRLHFNYTANNETDIFYVDVPQNTNETTNGFCGNVTQNLSFTFNDSTLMFIFNKTGKGGKNVALISLTYNFTSTLVPQLGPNKTYTATAVNLTHYECPAGKGFLCNSNTTINFDGKSVVTRLETVALRVEAFRKTNDSVFDKDYTQCDQDNRVSNIVPIAVGAALGALVLVVLIAYLVGRKRNQRGYETV